MQGIKLQPCQTIESVYPLEIWSFVGHVIPCGLACRSDNANRSCTLLSTLSVSIPLTQIINVRRSTIHYAPMSCFQVWPPSPSVPAFMRITASGSLWGLLTWWNSDLGDAYITMSVVSYNLWFICLIVSSILHWTISRHAFTPCRGVSLLGDLSLDNIRLLLDIGRISFRPFPAHQPSHPLQRSRQKASYNNYWTPAQLYIRYRPDSKLSVVKIFCFLPLATRVA